jgi:hypothetical protein
VAAEPAPNHSDLAAAEPAPNHSDPMVAAELVPNRSPS